MKKSLFLMLIAAIMMACSGNGNSEVTIPDDFKKFDGAKFSLAYPPALSDNRSDDPAVFYGGGQKASLQVSYITDAPNAEGMQAYADKLKDEKSKQGLTVGELKVEDNVITLRCTGERSSGQKEVNYFFVKVGENGKGLRCMYNIDEDAAAEFEPYLAPIIKSLTLK